MIACIALLTLLQEPNPDVLQTLPPVAAEAAAHSAVIYEIDDLTGHHRIRELGDQLVARIGAGETNKDVLREALDELASAGEWAADTASGMVSTIRSRIDPRLVGDEAMLEHLKNGKLLLNGTEAQHTWLRAYLEICRLHDSQILVRTTIITLPAGSLEKLRQERSGQVLPKAQAEKLLKAAQALDGVEVVSCPNVLTNPFRKASLTSVEQVAYIKDYELIVLQDQFDEDGQVLATEIADPVVSVAQDGVILDLVAVPISKDSVSIEAKLTYSDLTLPIQTFETNIGALGHPVTIQLPEIKISRLQGTFELTPGETLAIANTDPNGANEVLMLMTAETLLPEIDQTPSRRAPR